MITIFLGILTVTEVLVFIKVMLDFFLALYFRKRDKKQIGEILSYQIADLNNRVTALESKDCGWQYPSKGKYPKEGEEVFCYCKGEDFEFCRIGRMIVGGDNKIRWWCNDKEELHVIAWQRIILPEIKE